MPSHCEAWTTGEVATPFKISFAAVNTLVNEALSDLKHECTVHPKATARHTQPWRPGKHAAPGPLPPRLPILHSPSRPSSALVPPTATGRGDGSTVSSPHSDLSVWPWPDLTMALRPLRTTLTLVPSGTPGKALCWGSSLLVTTSTPLIFTAKARVAVKETGLRSSLSPVAQAGPKLGSV